VDSDRATLRWACREAWPCALTLPGRGRWGHTFAVDLRDDGPRPRLAIAQALDLGRGSPLPLAPGATVRLWSTREGTPWQLRASVAARAVVEGRQTGPVDCALLRLPYRLSTRDRHLRAPIGDERIRLDLAEPGGAAVTLLERWQGASGPEQRGSAHVVELSRKAWTFSLPVGEAPPLLRGAPVEVGIDLPERGMRTRCAGVVDALFDQGGHRLFGLLLTGPAGDGAEGERREVLRRAAQILDGPAAPRG